VTTAEPPGPRYEVRLTGDDVGARVVVRRRLPAGGHGDLLGELVRWDDEVVVRDRSGALRSAARGDVVAAKRVPPAPARR
jgi:hypothetical protein